MVEDELIDQLINDLQSSKLTKDDISKKYNITQSNTSSILKFLSQSPELLNEHLGLMIQKSNIKVKRGKPPSAYYLVKIPLVTQIYDITLGISLLNFKVFFQKYEQYLNYSSDSNDYCFALENLASYLKYDMAHIQSVIEVMPNPQILKSNIFPILVPDDLSILENVAHQFQEPDEFLSRHFIRQDVVGICRDFLESIEYLIESLSDPKDLPIFGLQADIRYLSYALRYYKNNDNYGIYSQLLEISERLFVILFIHPSMQESLLLPQTEISNGRPPDLVNNFKKLGINTRKAAILEILLLNNEVPISKFAMNPHLNNKKNREKSLNNLLNEGIVISYNKLSKNQRNNTYYKLNVSPEQIYEYIESKCKVDAEELYDLVKLKDWNDFLDLESEDIVHSLTFIGIEVYAARVLVYLQLHPETFGNAIFNDLRTEVGSSFTQPLFTKLMRELYAIKWIAAEDFQHGGTKRSDKRYSLSKPLDEIVIEYVLNHLENTKQSLTEIKSVISELDDYEPFNYEDTVLPYGIILEEGYSLFVEGLKSFIISDSGLNDGSFVIELKSPHPKLIRVYLTIMQLSPSKDTYRTRITYHKKRDDIWNFDNESVSYVLFCGYISELNLFILFDASNYKNVVYAKRIDISASKIYEAVVNPQVFKAYLKNKEIIIISSPDNLSQALEQRYSLYIQKLISE